MNKIRLALLTALFALPAGAITICSNTYCGTIRCARGCVQQSVNGVCTRNYCTGRAQALSLETDDASAQEEQQFTPIQEEEKRD